MCQYTLEPSKLVFDMVSQSGSQPSDPLCELILVVGVLRLAVVIQCTLRLDHKLASDRWWHGVNGGCIAIQIALHGARHEAERAEGAPVQVECVVLVSH